MVYTLLISPIPSSGHSRGASSLSPNLVSEAPSSSELPSLSQPGPSVSTLPTDSLKDPSLH